MVTVFPLATARSKQENELHCNFFISFVFYFLQCNVNVFQKKRDKIDLS